AVLTLREGATLDPAELIQYCVPRMAHFMVPRYVWVVDELPRTPTQKVQKHLLRSGALKAELWDREKAGVTVKREKIARAG
ncbi:MAG: ATP-dependent acyl-CoA ligase, partial [Nevskia sp.]|nr:ATP-dependent acyl-CoA ligase [Nevskia sp.]